MNHTTRAQRINARQDKIWEKALDAKAKAENTKHTPGPWVVREPDHFIDGLAHFIISEHPAEGYWEIAEMGTHNGRAISEANARLIASAPDLLWLVARARSILNPSVKWTKEETARSWAAWEAEAREAIAKAEGR